MIKYFLKQAYLHKNNDFLLRVVAYCTLSGIRLNGFVFFDYFTQQK